MKLTYGAVAALAAIATVGVYGCSADVEQSPTQASESARPSDPAQAKVANATYNLERAFSEQFVNGHIDRESLAGPISDVVQAAPEEARPEVQRHIDDALQFAEKVVTQATPEERAQLAAPVDAKSLGRTEQYWGWPGAVGWGGWGAFGFPAGWGGWGGGWGGAGWGGVGWGGAGWGGAGLGGWGRGFGRWGRGWGRWGGWGARW